MVVKIPNQKLVSVVICTYRNDRYEDLVEVINSLKAQTYPNLEIVVVVDGNEELYDRILKSEIEVEVILNEENKGLSESRNGGVKIAKGDVIAFIDDDAVADEEWIRELMRMYEERGAIAAGGKLLPKWVAKEAKFLPEEFYWLIGATHKGFTDDGDGVTEVRNTFGSNLSFKVEILEALGGFRSEMGVKGKGLLQGEETELCERMRNKFKKGVIYNPEAVVYHKVFPERLKLRFLLRRAFWQGYSKRVMKEQGYAISEERNFIKVLFGGVGERVKAFSLTAYVQLLLLFILTIVTVMGYTTKAAASHLKFKKSV